MPVYKYKKTYAAPALGVNYGIKSNLLLPGQWKTLQQLRCRMGAVTAFPGWATILASGNAGGFGTLLGEYRKQDGTVKLIVGGPTKLYLYDPTPKTLSDLSGAVTFGPTRDRPWDFTTYNDTFYVTNKVDGVYKYTGSGNFANIATAPKFWTIRILNNYFCGFGVDTNPLTFRWGDEGSDSVFTATATNSAGEFDIIDTSDEAVALENLDRDLVGYKQKNIHVFNYIGGRSIIGQRRAVSGVGLIGPKAIAAFTDRHIFMGDPPGFYEYAGGSHLDDSIGDPVREKVFGEINQLLKNRSRALIWPETHEILFMYPDTLSSTCSNRCVVYNYKEKTWYGPFPIQCEICGFANVNLSTLIDNVSAIIDTIPDLIDTYGVTAYSSLRLFMNSAGNIYQLGTALSDNGTALSRNGETGELFIGKEVEDEYGRVLNFPLGLVFQVNQVNIEFGNVSNQNIKFAIGSKMDLSDVMIWSSDYILQSNTAHKIEVPVRKLGRYFALRFTLQDNADMELLGYQLLFNVAGVR